MPASTYQDDYVKQAEIACRLGAIDQDLADLFNVKIRTIQNWKNAHPEFKLACDTGKQVPNSKVEQALLSRAIGCTTFKEVLDKSGCPVRIETEHPPDTTACMAWLNNRSRDRWKRDPNDFDKDKKTDGNTYNIQIVKPDDINNNAD